MEYCILRCQCGVHQNVQKNQNMLFMEIKYFPQRAQSVESDYLWVLLKTHQEGKLICKSSMDKRNMRMVLKTVLILNLCYQLIRKWKNLFLSFLKKYYAQSMNFLQKKYLKDMEIPLVLKEKLDSQNKNHLSNLKL